ncbi:GNAT family N-acetyltransferase [Salipiger mucosus]|uniref:Histone acetyltransferase HPA2 n=1 Tax=Salipiger mucosus DSM 16094 TaxID=1123237 RepID=S9R021_9RHOB|nr:GNAT family N-acetyltransferase [Salipiger mucosus]EPX86976.1 Histone acetyltransferase HPA2 [Salipiger mucosus DSM 16094]
MTPELPRLLEAVDATWPAARSLRAGPWRLREGAGGGKRVSCTTAEGDWTPDGLQAAEQAQALLGQDPLFMIREGDEALDAALARRSYEVIDPVTLWLSPLAPLVTEPIPRITAFAVSEPLAVMREIWEEAGIGAARQRIMERPKGPRTTILGRTADRAAGTAFCAVDGEIAMVHALEIVAPCRGRGLGKWMMRQAAVWAETQGAHWMSVLCLTDNAAAMGLYRSLGFSRAGRYHYRRRSET